MDITLLDSLGKRTDFLRSAAQLLGLEGVTVVCARAERPRRSCARALTLPSPAPWRG